MRMKKGWRDVDARTAARIPSRSLEDVPENGNTGVSVKQASSGGMLEDHVSGKKNADVVSVFDTNSIMIAELYKISFT